MKAGIAMRESVLEVPSLLNIQLGTDAPKTLTALGNTHLLELPKTALFSSARCPGESILRAHDQAMQWRDEGRCIISGFHSPVEQDCLRILLRGSSPVIVCPARTLPRRLPEEWQAPLTEGRMLILSGCQPNETRISAALAIRRNNLVAALADDVWFAHITPGGEMERLSKRIASLTA